MELYSCVGLEIGLLQKKKLELGYLTQAICTQEYACLEFDEKNIFLLRHIQVPTGQR